MDLLTLAVMLAAIGIWGLVVLFIILVMAGAKR